MTNMHTNPWAAPTAPPPPPRRRRNPWMIIGWVIVGCMVLFGSCAALVAVVATGSGSETKVTVGADVKAGPPRDGMFEFKVGKAAKRQTYGDDEFTRQTAQGVYWVVPVTVTNIGDEPRSWDAGSQVAYDSKGRKYQAESSIFDSDNFLEPINPGNGVKGTVVFDVPESAKLTHLELHDDSFSNGVRVVLS